MILRYLFFLTEPFFRWWWAAITGIASVLSFFMISGEGVNLSRLAVSIAIIVLSALIFFAFSVVVRGWTLFEQAYLRCTVASIQRCTDFGSTHIFLLSGRLRAPKGTLFEIRRRIGAVEAPFAIVELLDQNAQNLHQAKPLWVAPIHMSDFQKNKFLATDLVVNEYIDANNIRGNIESFKPSEQ